MIKQLVIALALVTIYPATTKANSSVCPMIGDISRYIMTIRQNLVEMDKVMALFSSDNALDKTLRAITIEAYDVPMYLSQEYVTRAINEFANTQMKECYKHTNS